MAPSSKIMSILLTEKKWGVQKAWRLTFCAGNKFDAQDLSSFPQESNSIPVEPNSNTVRRTRFLHKKVNLRGFCRGAEIEAHWNGIMRISFEQILNLNGCSPCSVVVKTNWNVRKNVGHIQPTNAHDPFHWQMVLEKAYILTWYLYGSRSLTVWSGAEKMTHFLT